MRRLTFLVCIISLIYPSGGKISIIVCLLQAADIFTRIILGATYTQAYMVYQIAVIVIHMLLHLTHVKKQDKLVKQIEIPECIHNKKQKN